MLLALSLPCAAQDNARGHFHFAGPMSRFLPEGGTPAPVTSGLPFAVTLTDKGATIAPASFELQGKNWGGAAKLTFEGLKFDAGHLTGTVKIKNDSGSVLEGVRLDITGATEEYKAKDAGGSEGTKTRPQAVKLDSPLLFGDVPKGDDADSAALDVSGIAFAPETTKVTVSGVLSGLYYLGAFTGNGDNCVPVSLDVDAKGRVYFADRNQSAVYRAEADGKNVTAVAKLPAEAGSIAIDPTSGDIWATFINGHKFLHYSPGGDDKEGSIEVDKWPGHMRFDRSGNFYAATEDFLNRFKNGKPAWQTNQIGDYTFNSDPVFDIDRDGSLWIAANDTLYRLDSKGENGRRVVIGPNWYLGRLNSPKNVRVDAQGDVYVIEGKSETEYARISVFDKNGRIIRAFGRGAKEPLQEGLQPGQIAEDTYDIAFGLDGRVYVAHEDPSHAILMFQPF
jgi:hypothetical protein